MSAASRRRAGGRSAEPAGAIGGEGGHASGLLRLEVASIKAYDRNPRRGENPEYHRIKASIRAEGMDQALVVTQRPGDEGYMLHAGGNTRLRILQELHAETGEERFRIVACVFRPWSSEADVLLAHLKENDLRGALSFRDKALAVREARRLIEAQSEEGVLTQSRLAGILRSRGYSVSQGLISQMEYTTEVLLALLPGALESGIGRPQVERFRNLERASRTLWRERCVGTEAEYEEALAALCRRYDGPDWAIANLRRALEAEIAERAEISIHLVSVELDARLAGRTSDAAPASTKTSIARTSDPHEDVEEPGAQSVDEISVGESRTGGSLAEGVGGEPRGSSRACIPATSSTAAAAGHTPTSNAAADTVGDNTLPGAGDLKSLRARAWTLASRLAQRNGLGELIEPLSGTGLGFVLRDVPDPALVERLDEDTLAQISMLWWQLAACSEVTVAPVTQLLPALAEGSVLRRALEEQDAGLLFAGVWTLDPGHTGYRLWRRVDDRDWADLLSLMETYRALHHAAERLGEPLWS